MITPFVALALGAIVAAMIFFGVLKGLKTLFILAALLLVMFIGYVLFWPGATTKEGPAIFRGPINIHIIPPQGTSENLQEKLKATAENTAKEYFDGSNVRDPFQEPRGK